MALPLACLCPASLHFRRRLQFLSLPLASPLFRMPPFAYQWTLPLEPRHLCVLDTNLVASFQLCPSNVLARLCPASLHFRRRLKFLSLPLASPLFRMPPFAYQWTLPPLGLVTACLPDSSGPPLLSPIAWSLDDSLNPHPPHVPQSG